MQIIENNLIKEKVFIEKLESGMTLMCIPKKNAIKKYIIIGVNYGSNDFKFEVDGEKVEVPEGVAHYLEHKMFEQENGNNSLDVLSSMGINANAYTTNDYTAYLFGCTDHFYEGLDELLDYVQNPYFTDENVEKERGIITQEIQMYKDEPYTEVYMNAMRALYKNHPLRIDVAGTVESIQKIDKDILYKCYNNFYVPENMVIVVSGDFLPEEIFREIKSRLNKDYKKITAKKIRDIEPDEINEKKIEINMDISTPIFIIGYKDKIKDSKKIKRQIAVEILLELILGNSSKLYKELYDNGLIHSELGTSYEFSKDYAHVLIQGHSKNIDKVIEKIENEIENVIKNGIDDIEYERIKRKIYGFYVRDFDSVESVANCFLMDYFKNINSFDYFEEYIALTKEYVESIGREIFDKKNMILSIVNPK